MCKYHQIEVYNYQCEYECFTHLGRYGDVDFLYLPNGEWEPLPGIPAGLRVLGIGDLLSLSWVLIRVNLENTAKVFD